MPGNALRSFPESGNDVTGDPGRRWMRVMPTLSDYLPGFLIVSFASLLVFPLLYIFRFHDNNTLTSWQWVFDSVSLTKMYLLVFSGLVLAALLSTVPLSHRTYHVILIVLSSFAVYPAWAEPEVILDASRYIVQAKYAALHGPFRFLLEWGSGIDAWTDMPLISFFHGLIFRYAGESRVYIQGFHTLLFSLSVLFTFLLGKELWDEETGFFAGLMIMTIPYLLTQVPLMIVDVPVMFFVVLAFYCTLRAVKDGGILMVLLASLSVFLALMSKYSTWVMLLILPAALIPYRRVDPGKKTIRLFIMISITLALLSLAVAFNYGVFREQIELLRTYQLPALNGWGESWVSTLFFQSHPFLLLFAAAGIYVSIKERDSRILIAGWFFIFILIFQVHRIRYIIPLFPLFALMGARGLRSLVSEHLRRYIAFSMISLSLIVAYAGFVPFLEKTSMSNLQKAGAYLDAMNVPVAEVIPLPQESSSGNTLAALPILDLYTETKLVYSERIIPERSDDRELLPLRFTWEYGFDGLYAGAYREPGAVVMISSSYPDMTSLRSRFPGLGISSDPSITFISSSSAFRYKTYVSVFKP